ncbi:trypsin-like serine protease [Candidatus Dojkabacteria bacterium]|uniref:Trypsin-like serine protease n=1 Tax=Candidatus Dojkabacteria bacterium TaxID=2099670 RepID=A0A955LA94_9BACT|nr:trypsin-like serine protease [Candidatus Dojkabacteria bacterium]
MKKLITVIIIVVLALGAFGLFYKLLQQNLALDDSDALFGGELEKGYPFSGYLISYEPGGAMKTCGYAVLNKNVAVTASHCVDNSESIYLGLGDFSLLGQNHVSVIKATQKEQWVQSKTRSHDFAILNINDTTGFYSEFAEIATPTEGCKYKVVAYGRTEDPSENFEKPRKSATLCARDISANTFIIKGDGTSGICFGDSGSPIFYKDTNKLAGIVVSIILEDPNDTEPCAFGNTAIAVRPDANQNLINENIQALNAGVADVSVVDGLTITVAEQNFFDRIGLSQINNLSDAEQKKYLLYGTATLTVFMVLMLLIIVARKPKSNSNWE